MNHHPSSPVPATPLDVEDLLHEILLRLPPNPCSLPRASLVSKNWRRILSNPQFLCRFCKHHQQKLPLLGFFDKACGKAPIFTPMLDPPDRIPTSCFSLPRNLVDWYPWATVRIGLSFSFFGCRHGIVLFLDRTRRVAVLWNPLTGVQCCVPFPPEFGDDKDDFIRSAAVLCPAGDNPFKLVFAYHDVKDRATVLCIYESMSGVWGDIISTTTSKGISSNRPSILVGNALCWLLEGGSILEFDVERHTLVEIEKPTGTHAIDCYQSFQILRGEDNDLGLAILSKLNLSIQLWTRKPTCDGVVSWVLQNTVKLDELFSQPLRPGAEKLVRMPGYDEDTNVIFLSSLSHDFMLHLETMQLRHMGRQEHRSFRIYYPYTHFIAGI